MKLDIEADKIADSSKDVLRFMKAFSKKSGLRDEIWFGMMKSDRVIL
jgi:hypothetical protein